MKVSQKLKQVTKRVGVLALVVLMLSSLALSTSAASISDSTFVPYTTYTYDFDGMDMKSPHAYVADSLFDRAAMGLRTALKDPSDLFYAPDGHFYVADTGNNRIVAFDENLQYAGVIGGIDAPFINYMKIVPYVKQIRETEDAEWKSKFAKQLERYAEREENPVQFTITEEDYVAIRDRLATVYLTPSNMVPVEAEYQLVKAEYEANGKVMPTAEEMLAIIDYVSPVALKYSSLSEEEIASQSRGETDEEKAAYEYWNQFLLGETDDPSADALVAPEGVFVTEDGTLYIADTGSGRIVKMQMPADSKSWRLENYEVVATVEKPETSILSENYVFKPTSLVLDAAGRMYINVKNDNAGIMQLSADGEFMGYYGAQKVTGSVFQWFLQLFQTAEQRARTVRTVPRVYNNIAIDSKNFVWITANSMENADLFAHIASGDTTTAPVKRLNPSGDDVLVRNGIWAPAGDVTEHVDDVSSIVDVAVKGDTGIYTLVDDKTNKLFTYDGEGNLLYAFGGSGSQLGVFTLITAAVYQGTDLLVMDKTTGCITRFKQTDYAAQIEVALNADAAREYEKAEAAWKYVQKLNSNFDLAYIGLAKSYLRSAAQAESAEAKELYQQAMEYYKLARDTEGYSKAFKEYRSLYVRDNLLLILAVPVVIGVALYFAFRAINRVNAKLHITGTKTTFVEELCYGWRAVFHPINGFWEIKREKRGSMRAAFVFLGLAVLAFIFQATGTAYLFNNVTIEEISLVQQACNVLIPVVLWVVASWCFTTLMSGEGSMKDIFIALCYGLIPLIVLLIPSTLISHIFSLDEQPFLTFFQSLAYLWMGLLVVFGSMVVQDYTFSKNLLTVILSVLGMAAIMFLVLLLFSLTGKLWGFIETIFQEIAYRL
ncbi:MAG: hypothetical protein E7549_04735 [Ruminococcaceae bacterium]|nr:hypothetical protein [Oscillospiraceae bacterium]